jgi:hypothetical protein
VLDAVREAQLDGELATPDDARTLADHIAGARRRDRSVGSD